MHSRDFHGQMVSKCEALEKIEFLQEFAINFYMKNLIEAKRRCTPLRWLIDVFHNLYKLYKKIVRDTHFFYRRTCVGHSGTARHVIRLRGEC